MALFNKRDLIARADSELLKSFSSKSASTILESAALQFDRYYDIFLSHSFSDAKVIFGLKKEIEDMGFSVYVDWIEDKQLNRSNVSKKTAEILRNRMVNCKSLFFATSDNSSDSIWMPWELGYFDGIKGKVAILPITDQVNNRNSYSGQEYLGLYSYVTKDYTKGGKLQLWIQDSHEVYISLPSWLEGTKPFKRQK